MNRQRIFWNPFHAQITEKHVSERVAVMMRFFNCLHIKHVYVMDYVWVPQSMANPKVKILKMILNK